MALAFAASPGTVMTGPTASRPSLSQPAKSLAPSLLIDGEAVIAHNDGMSDFRALRKVDRVRLTWSRTYSENIDLDQYCLRSKCRDGLVDLEEIPMRRLALTILTMGIVLTAGHARAQTYDPAFPFCVWGSGYHDCSYYTMDQCRASANGQQCIPNPYYVGATASGRRNNRRY